MSGGQDRGHGTGAWEGWALPQFGPKSHCTSHSVPQFPHLQTHRPFWITFGVVKGVVHGTTVSVGLDAALGGSVCYRGGPSPILHRTAAGGGVGRGIRTVPPIRVMPLSHITAGFARQNFLRCQNNKTNYNLVCETLQFLDIMCGSTTGGLGLLGLYINEYNVALITQTLETLTEYCQGPCHENQVCGYPCRVWVIPGVSGAFHR